ncbi:MAG: hypothetical protein K8953_01535, partial [Proteobacteria bacterium]|nr:hypothetical protein [Pseudomonadota bacterium]
SNAAVLKTVEVRASQGSNPCLSAKIIPRACGVMSHPRFPLYYGVWAWYRSQPREIGKNRQNPACERRKNP